MINVLFVCLGNICRSPMAEAIFKEMVSQKQLDSQIHSDSAGIESYHIGANPDPRTILVLNEHGITNFQHQARKISAIDMEKYHYVIVMEKAVFEECKSLLRGQPKLGLLYMGAFDPLMEGNAIKDPYNGSISDFEAIYQRLVRCCTSLLDDCILKLNTI